MALIYICDAYKMAELVKMTIQDVEKRRAKPSNTIPDPKPQNRSGHL